ncbi:MAG: glycosyltransferase family 39 protein [Nitrospinae bacterium]|nr:glycosyltransferase family 39 protein [Nitrospinota bacterium]
MAGHVRTPVAMMAGRWLVSAGVLGLALWLVFYRLGDGSLYNWDEAIYAQAAKEVLRSQTWGTLHWNGSPFFHKPPLYIWLTALTFKLLGVSEFAARLWSAVFGWGVIVLTFVLGVRFRSWAVGAAAALLLLTVDRAYYSQWWNFLSLARVGVLDTALTFCIMLALLLAWMAERRTWLIAWIGLPVGLAVMTKAWPGLLAGVIPVGYWLLSRKGRAAEMGWWMVAGVGAAVVMLPWHLWQYWVHGQLFLGEYVSVNLVGRLFHTVEEHHGDPLFYLGVLQQGFPLWGYLWPLAFGWAVWQAYQQRDRRACMLLCWITVPLLLFSMAQTKLGWYINMVYPAIALLVGLALAELLTDKVTLGIVAAVMLACCIRLPAAPEGSAGVKPFAPHAAQYVDPTDTVSVVEPTCATRMPSLDAAVLLFYLNRRLTCLDERDILAGRVLAHAYAIIDQASWARFSHLGRIVFAEDGYILARWN